MACLSPPAFANVPRRMLLCDISEEAFDKIELECTRWCEERMETAMLATQRFTASVLRPVIVQSRWHLRALMS